MKFLDLNGVSILWRRIKETFARKSETVSDISRDDTTFTVTKADGTTFEFTQKDTTYNVATTASSGLMSAADKAKLNGVESGAQPNVIESVSVNGTEQSVTNKGVDITVPTALSDLTDDVGYLTEESDPTVPTWAKQPQKPAYTASEVGALPADTHIPTDVSELNNDAGYLTEHQDISGIEDAIAGLTTKLNALADSDDTTLDQLSEIVAYIKNNKSLIDGITTGKVSVNDIVDNLTSTAANKPLSAKQGKVLKDMIDGIVVPTKVSQLMNDVGYLTQHQDISGKANTADLSAVATSGSYTDLTNKPTIPVVDNTLTVTGAAADAKKTGDELYTLKEETSTQISKFSSDITTMQNSLPGMISDKMDDKFGQEIGDNVSSWLTEHVNPAGSAVVVDDTLTIQGAAADAKKTGDDVSSLKEDFSGIGTYEYPYAMVNGAYNTANGEPTASINYRIRTNDFISIEDFAYASAPSGYGVIVFAWNDSTYLGASVASYSYATSCTAKEIKDKFPTATRVKVAFSNLSSQYISAIEWKTYGLSIVCKSNVEASISDQYETGENLVDFRTLRDSTSISTSTGAESINADRWTSDFIPYDAVNHPKVIYTKRILASCIAYDSNKTYIANITSNALIDSVPDNTAYLRICGVKTTVSIADAPHRVFVGYADVASGLTAHKMLNDSYYGVKRRGYINLNSITPYAESDGSYKTSFELTIERTEESYKNMILGIRAKYVGTDAPSITFKYYFTTTSEAYNIYASKPHTFGGNGCYEVNEFRNPPFPKYKMSLSVIVTIPTGTTVYIDDLWNEYSDRVGGYDVGVRMNAHQGFIPLCIADTLSSFRMAGKLGFNRCVTIPKETSDGVLVCYHNDGAIGTTLVDGNGNPPDATTQAKKISEITYSELSGYYVSAPNRLSSIYQDEKVPTLEEFFAVCSRTGMHPMLSVHPEPTLAGWNNIKTLAKKYGLLSVLNIKIGYALTDTAFDNPYAVFGSDIESYVIDVSTSGITGAEYAQYLDAHLPDCECRVVVEYFYSVITDERISETLEGGYEVACAELATQPTSEYKRLMSLGVTEFTNDNFSSVGLNW